MNFVCIVIELSDKMLTLSSMENLIVQCNHEELARHTVMILSFWTYRSGQTVQTQT